MNLNEAHTVTGADSLLVSLAKRRSKTVKRKVWEEFMSSSSAVSQCRNLWTRVSGLLSRSRGRRAQLSDTNRFVKFGILGAAAVILLGNFAAVAVGQQITATITGTVNDAQGALIVGATVTATNLDTGISSTTKTNSEAIYNLGQLPIGKYTVRASSPGFKELEQQNIVLSLNQTLSLNLVLEVGAVDQTVTVSGAPPVVNTTTPELGRTVQPEEITELPLVNRDVYTEVSLTPGVQSNSGSALTANTPNMIAGQPPAEAVVINGGIDGASPMVSFYLDGGSNMTAQRNYGNQLPNPDAIQEFRVETANFSAQYGRFGSAAVTAVTRSGTNQFHGSLFEFVRNTDFNAVPWGATTKAPYHRNNFGGTVGGPVIHQKAFFFFSYGGLRQVTGQFLSGGIVPTALERAGNFSVSKILPINPATNTVYNYNGVAGWIPPTALDPTAQNIINKYIPLPNSTGNTWTGYFTSPLTDNEYLAKYDQTLSQKDQVTAEYFTIGDNTSVYGGGNLLYSATSVTSRQQNAILSETHIFNDTTVNQAWVTFTQSMDNRDITPAVSLGDLGSKFTIQGPKALPTLTVAGYFAANSNFSGSPIGDDFYSVRDLVNATRKKHTLNFGGEVSLDHILTVGNLSNYGIFTFNTSAPATTKNALADFVTGTVASMEQDSPYSSHLSTFHYALFVQDAYRVRPRFTLNLGLRYDIDTPPVQTHDITQTFLPNVQSVVVPSAPLGLLYPGDKGVTRGIVGVPYRHISPRVGIVWDPFGDGKTAIRAGSGIFFGSVSGNQWNQPANALPFAARQTWNSIASLTNVYGDPTSFPNGNPFPYIYTPKNPKFLPSAAVETIALGFRWPYTYQVNLAVEHQFPGGVAVTTAYVGSMTHNVPTMVDANFPAYAPGATTSQASIQSRRPHGDNGALGQVTDARSNWTTSYHSLQISAEKKMGHSVMLNGFYVFSKTFLAIPVSGVGLAGAQDYDALWEERGPSDLDQRHMASISGIWDLKYYHGSNKVVKQLANGWEITSIASFNSGMPLNITTGTSNNASGMSTNRPNLVSGVNAFLDPHRSRAEAAAKWFNPAAFVTNAPGAGIGAYGADGNTPRDYLRAPGYRNIDIGAFRSFLIMERIKLQIRAEATNAFNLVSLAAPNATLSSAKVGVITSAVANSNRQIQLGARLTF